MSSRTEWYKTDLKGQLFVETVLVEGNEPVLFTCLDEAEQRYLVEMLDSFDGKYLIVPIDTSDLIDMLQNKTTLERTFRNQQAAYLTCFDDEFDLILDQVKTSGIPDDVLPLPGEYFELYTPKIQKYVQQLSEEGITVIIPYTTNANILVFELCVKINADVSLEKVQDRFIITSRRGNIELQSNSYADGNNGTSETSDFEAKSCMAA